MDPNEDNARVRARVSDRVGSGIRVRFRVSDGVGDKVRVTVLRWGHG